MKTSRRIGIMVLAIPVFYLTMCSTYYAAKPISATIIDAATNKPLEGVVVVAHWELEGGLEGGNIMGQVKVMEAVTDKAGRFNFPAWGPKRISVWAISGTRLKALDPELLLFKSGYKYLRLQNTKSMAQMRRKGPVTRTSDWNGKVIKMERFVGTLQEYSRHLDTLDSDLWDSAADESDKCKWKYIPLMISAIGSQARIFQASNIHRATFYDELLASDDNMVHKGCGSVKEFIGGNRK